MHESNTVIIYYKMDCWKSLGKLGKAIQICERNPTCVISSLYYISNIHERERFKPDKTRTTSVLKSFKDDDIDCTSI